MKVLDLKKYKDGLYTSLSRDLDAFEKNFILVSTGLLAFSITFIKDIVKIEVATYLPVLFIGWFLILVSVGLMMFAFLSSVNGSNQLWKIVDDYIILNKLFTAETDLTSTQSEEIKKSTNDSLYKIKKRLKKLRQYAIWSFLFGVMFFSIFVGINLVKENKKVNTIHIVNSKKSPLKITLDEKVTTSNDSIIILNYKK